MAKHMTVHFTDGTKTSFDFPQQAQDPVQLAKRVKEAFDHDKLLVEAEGVLFMIPLNNVKYVQLSPAPAKLPPEMAIQGARISQ